MSKVHILTAEDHEGQRLRAIKLAIEKLEQYRDNPHNFTRADFHFDVGDSTTDEETITVTLTSKDWPKFHYRMPPPLGIDLDEDPND